MTMSETISKNQKKYHIAQGKKYITKILKTTTILESKPEVLEKLRLVTKLTLFKIEEISCNFSSFLGERASKNYQIKIIIKSR